MKVLNWTTPIIAAALLAGCASTAIPADKISRAESAIRGAREVGAERVPSAALHLRLAEEQLAVAKRLIADGENERAVMVLARAETDAEAANNMAREQAMKAEAQRASEAVREMKAKAQRAANTEGGGR